MNHADETTDTRAPVSTPNAAVVEATDAQAPPPAETVPVWYRREDWVAVLLGLGILTLAAACLRFGATDGYESHPWSAWLGSPGAWIANPFDGLQDNWSKVLGALLFSLIGFTWAAWMTGRGAAKFAMAFPVVFAIGFLAFVMDGQETVAHLNLSYALWALLTGLVISNTVGVPDWLRPAVCTELFIKTGLVILGAEILFHQLLALGIPGVFVAWIVTPIVLITTYWFGQRVLKIESRSLNMVICADMSVCGVSAAIAAAASCKAKKEELSLAISMSLIFTVVMMVVMPFVVNLIGLDPVVGGAWIGGTIDSTGAVAAAGSVLGDVAEKAATTIKMIQNILIGAASLGIAIYWVTFVEPKSTGKHPGIGEIWRRFPRFVIGFLLASVAFTFISITMVDGQDFVSTVKKGATKELRNWFFCLAFVSIGLDTRFADLWPYLRGGKPLLLYLCGQTLNIILTLAMAYLMFGVLFAETVQKMMAP